MLLGHYYAWATPERVADMTLTQVRTYMEGGRLLEYRRHFHTASLTATILNALGGKGDGKPTPRAKLYHPEEFLAGYANPYITRLPREAARDILHHARMDYFPSWVLSLLPSESELKQAASV